MTRLEEFASGWGLNLVGNRILGCYGYIEEHDGELWVWTSHYSPKGHEFFPITGFNEEIKAVLLMRPGESATDE